MPSQSLTDEIMGLAYYAHHSDGLQEDMDAFRSRLQSLESELTELREKTKPISVEDYRKMPPTLSAHDFRIDPRCIEQFKLNDRPIELGTEDGG